jgi:hypothetical protein
MYIIYILFFFFCENKNIYCESFYSTCYAILEISSTSHSGIREYEYEICIIVLLNRLFSRVLVQSVVNARPRVYGEINSIINARAMVIRVLFLPFMSIRGATTNELLHSFISLSDSWRTGTSKLSALALSGLISLLRFTSVNSN